MTELWLVAGESEDGPFSTSTPLPRRLPNGRHGIPANLVVEHQRRRLLAAMADTLTEHGYGSITTAQVSKMANVSTSTFYKHFGNIWDCLLAAYVAAADRLCEEIDAACAARNPQLAPMAVGIDAALAFFAAEPAQAQLLSAQAPLEASAIGAARRLLTSRLAAMLRRSRGPGDTAVQPPGLDERLIDATLAFVGSRISRGETERLGELGPELATILGRQRQAA
jgi:AcrR family transcriptional regulator